MPLPDRTPEFLQHFTANAQRIHGYILALMHHDGGTQDVFQEVSMLCWEKFDEFTPGTDFLAWARQIARFRVLKYWEAQRRRPSPFSDAFLDSLSTDIAAMGDRMDLELRALASCYKKLPPRDRELVDLRYRPGAKTREVAEQIGRPLSTVYRMLNKVHDALMRCIDRMLADEAMA